jgi:Fe-S cluster assembly protein SufD
MGRVTDVAAPATEPAWLQAWRQEAAAAAARLPVPRWDRTDAAAFDAPPGGEPGGAWTVTLPPGAAERGVVAGALAAVAAERPELVRRHLGTIVGPAAGRFEACNAASAEGVFVYVPDGLVVEGPLELVYRAREGAGRCHPRLVLALGRTAEATVVERHEGGPDGARGMRATAVAEAEVGDGAHLRFVHVQDWAAGVAAHVVREARLGRDASVQWLIGELGGAMVRSGTVSDLVAPGGEALSLLVFFASGSQHMDIATTLRHTAPRTNGNMLAKGVLAGHARAIYRGTSDIERGARDSNSQQRENVLHLDPGVRSDAIPALYINENELQAGHAATTGKVDAEQLFYLASRGLAEREALRLIVHGFFAPLLERVPVEEVRRQLDLLIDRKIDGDAGSGRLLRAATSPAGK